MTRCAGSQADGVWAMPSARALLVASLLTEPPFGCLGPSGNDRYRKRSEAVGASRVGGQVAVALSGTGDPETTTAGRQDKKPHIAAWTVGCFASAFSDFLHIVDRRHDVRVFIFANDFSEYRTSRVQL
ncbi:hypothetical protein [Afipia sp. Root123D2]|uniref:hypothetical protein n=1 Tax=Afipia sp. Root123D2 TaxID=1736436 RepID=UPI000B1EC44C|nr:hypothetical protein [Afipia sp. Root123D2]